MNWKLCVAGVVLVGVQSVFAQGSLMPPGAPAPAMKTLNQIEPRTPISSVPYTISEPGSYYLTTNLTSTSYGVMITASGVTLDLMGFTLSGSGNDDGVFVYGATNHVIKAVLVRNGAVKNFHIGIHVDYSQGGHFEQLSLFDNTLYGIALNGSSGTCEGNTIADCTLSGNSSYGVYLNGSSGQCNGNKVADCSISGNSNLGIYLYGHEGQCDGNTIADCSISGNSSLGIYLDGDGGRCYGNTIANCAISGNGSYGIYLDGRSSGRCDGNTISDCTISGNGYDGIAIDGNNSGLCYGNTVADCTISGNDDNGIMLFAEFGGQCDGNKVADCTISRNYNVGINISGYKGQCDGNTIANCTISKNNYGLHIFGQDGQCAGNTVADCTIRKNVDCGIHLNYVNGNRVEGNHVTGQTGAYTYGILCSSTTNNLIIRNSCVGQTNNFHFNSTDTYGPEISATGMITNMNPWANFSR